MERKATCFISISLKVRQNDIALFFLQEKLYSKCVSKVGKRGQ